MALLLVAAALLVAFANGANDNAKGIAPLVGCRMAALAPALRYANLATLLGAGSAIPLALYGNASLVKAFGGGGLLPPDFAARGSYLVAVGLGGLPLLFAAAPSAGAVKLFGVDLPWLLLGVAAFPFLVGVGWLYVHWAERNEQDFTALVERPER